MARSGVIVKPAFPVQTPAQKPVRREDVQERIQAPEQPPPDDRIDQLLEFISFKRRPQLSSEFLKGELITVGLGGNKTTQSAIPLLSLETNFVKHKLGRAVEGWHVVWQDRPANIYEDVNDGSDRTIYLPLKCTADVNVRLLVF
jgi:hypothetical protein